MYFESFREIIHMAGHGVFVWSAYGISFVVLAALIVHPLRRYQKQLRLFSHRSKTED